MPRGGPNSGDAVVVDGLLRFCDFVADRLYTENLELLRRVVADFYARPRRRHETVRALLAAGFPALTVLPVDNPDARALDRARVRLARIRRGDAAPPPVHAQALSELHDALCGRVQLANWHWLLRMYDDFCVGAQTSVARFVARRAPAIALFPIVPGAAGMVSVAAREEDQHWHVKPAIKRELTVNLGDDIADDDGDPLDDGGDSHPTRRRRARSGNDAIAEAVRAACHRAERNKPWERLFDVARIVYPFDAASHPTLAHHLRDFWERHARAVWERNFWAPLAQVDDAPGSRHYARKQRQSEAARCFERYVIVPAFAALGARFFVELDAHAAPGAPSSSSSHSGSASWWWWYRRPHVDLLKVAEALGVGACVQYTQTQAKKREPTLPTGFHVRTRGYAVAPRSMWSTHARTQHVALAVEELRAATRDETSSPRQRAKRRRDAEDDQDDD